MFTFLDIVLCLRCSGHSSVFSVLDLVMSLLFWIYFCVCSVLDLILFLLYSGDSSVFTVFWT